MEYKEIQLSDDILDDLARDVVEAIFQDRIHQEIDWILTDGIPDYVNTHPSDEDDYCTVANYDAVSDRVYKLLGYK